MPWHRSSPGLSSSKARPDFGRGREHRTKIAPRFPAPQQQIATGLGETTEGSLGAPINLLWITHESTKNLPTLIRRRKVPWRFSYIARRGDQNSDRLHEKTPRFDGVPDHRHHLSSSAGLWKRRPCLSPGTPQGERQGVAGHLRVVQPARGDAMLIQRLRGRAPERRLVGQHLPSVTPSE